MLWLYRYFNPSTKSENAASYVLALVLPCRWWSLRTARCLSIPPLGAKQSLLEHRQTEILSILRTCASSSTRSIHRWPLAFAQYQNPPLPPAVANSVHPSAFLHDVVSHTLRGRRRSFGCCGSVLSTAQGSCTRDLCRDIEGKQPILTTSSCREGAAYKQGQGAAP